MPPASTKTAQVGLAPMEGVTTFPTRLYFHLASQPAWMGTPFLRVTQTFPTRDLPVAFAPELGAAGKALPYKLVPQLMVTTADDFLRAAELFPDVDILELNAGCPSPTCVGKGAGSSMLKDPEAFHTTVFRLARDVGNGRLAVKMRTGYDDAAEFPGLLSGLAELPLARLTVHGRTRADAYRGRARWDLIGSAATAAKAPVFGSGDVVDRESLAALHTAAPGLSGVIVGRGALRNPWIFSEVRDGTAVRLTPETIVYSLVVFAMLNELYSARLGDLIHLAEAGWFTSTCDVDYEKWKSLAERLADYTYATSDAAPSLDYKLRLDGSPMPPPLARHTLGRVKMLWNYLRSSLPPLYFAPEIMRHRELGAFLGAIRALADAVPKSDTGEVPLAHNPTLDWLYASK